ncbi:phosphomannomutase/phosphoglucomutase [Candidatus Poribacteria bacterium]|nr:phosphomannomutase/phosphoglucomutase [Candidatus Poribacteria bacterium]
MEVDRSIFRAYDIRGRYPEQINPQLAYHIGRALATYLAPRKVLVARDMRISSNVIYQDLIAGFLKSSVDVVNIGLTSTDVFYHACADLKSPGVMATASHNPPNYGGFKIVEKLPYMLSQVSGLEQIYELILAENYMDASKEGKLTKADFGESFVNKMLTLVTPKLIKPMKVVADSGNGMSGPILDQVYNCLPQIELIHINEKPDGISPIHGWDPLEPENRDQLQRKVIDEGADLGFAFDGDGDRFFAIDDSGKFFAGDFLTSLFSQYFLKKYPGSKIVYDVRSSSAIPDQIKQLNGIAIKEKVGHSFIKKRMIEENAIFGGELTGHYYFRDFHFSDTAILPSLILLEILSISNSSLSSILANLEKEYFLSGEINIPIKEKSQIQTKFQELENFFDKEARIEKIDGVSVIFKDWRFNLRGSNTEPLIRLNLEAKSKSTLEEKLEFILKFISQ